MRTLMRFIAGIVAPTILSPDYGDVLLYDSSVSNQTPDIQNHCYVASDPLFELIQATQSRAANLSPWTETM